jgi:hypothetical protein
MSISPPKRQEMALPKDYQSDEFLHFLADILDPGTGALQLERLAAALGLSSDQEERLTIAVNKTGLVDAPTLFDLLEASYDRLGNLSAMIEWFLTAPQPAYGDFTPFEIILAGELEPLRRAQRKLLPAAK